MSHAVLAVAVYPALLLTQRGQVAADSKPLLFVDPTRFLSRALYLWDPTIGLGTVTHQNIGYLLPMGPWFWITGQLGVPVWVSQRLWLGTILFAAGAGMLFLARTLRWPGTAGPVVAALAFALSPFVVQYATHLSVLLLPFAGLPWLIACTLRATREGGWRWPAAFALVVAMVGTVNATTLAAVLLGPAVVWAIEYLRTRTERRRARVAAFRIVGLSIAVSAWWLVALLIESRYGFDVLDSTESLETVTLASTTPEVLRGLGYWFLYGRDAVAPYLDAGRTYTATWVLPASFVPMLLAGASAVTTRWRRRGTFVALLVVGTVVAVGAHPYDSPSPFGRAFRDFVENIDAARALRSITRVTPLVVLATAVLLGMGITALRTRFRTAGRLVVVVTVAAIALAITPLWKGEVVSATRTRPESVPQAWRTATAALDRSGTNTRVLELPGIDFGAYTWGYTNDSITRGLMDRPTVAREVVPYGTAASVDLVNALDRRIQEGTFDAAALAPIARLISAGSVLVRGDVDSRRYDLPDVEALWRSLTPLPEGVTRSESFRESGSSGLTILAVDHAPDVVHTAPTERPVIISGSGDGLVDAAEAGVLPDDRLIVYSGTLANRPTMARRLLRDSAEFIVTDSNRKRALRAKTLYDNNGYTERVHESPLTSDREDARLDLFPDAGPAAQSVAVISGPTARASSYGNPLTLVPSDRPMLAIDGDPTTAWRSGDFWRVLGERLEITLPKAVTTDRLTLLQAAGGNRSITRVRITFGDGSSEDVDFGAASRSEPGQVVHFPRRSISRFTVEVLATDPGQRVNNGGLSGVGFADVSIPGIAPARETVRLPRDLLELTGPDSEDHALTLVMTRLRAAPGEAPERAPELTLDREFDVPTGRTFDLTGTVRPVGDTVVTSGACLSDLLALDGTDLPVRIGDNGPGADVGLTVTTCDDAPVELGAGRHVLHARDGRTTGVAVDRVVLRSSAGGGVQSGSDPRAPAAPTVRVRRMNPTSADVDVTGARGPFWLVLGQSYSDGWQASHAGQSLGAPQLVDGYANGWYVDPGRSSDLSLSLRWTPQRWVWLSLAFSAFAILGCLILVSRRGSRTPSPRAPASTPRFDWPGGPPGAIPPPRTIVLTTIASTVVAIGLAGLAGGVVVGVVTLVALRVRRGRTILDLAAIASLGGATAYIVVSEVVDRYPADFPWPASFGSAHQVALVGVLLLGVDVLVGRLRPSDVDPDRDPRMPRPDST